MNNINRLISVIIPAYNAEKTLAETLHSVFVQTYTNIEVIVINDGSTDNTLHLLTQIKEQDSRLKIVSQSNQGIASARNQGITLATGDFLAFIDSDDRWHPQFLQKMIARQIQTQGDVIYSGNIDSSIKGDIPRINDFREQNNLVGYLTEKSLLHIGCLLIKKSFTKKYNIQFDVSLKTGEDILFICTLFCHINAYSVPEYLYYYVHRNNSIMRSNWTKQNYLDDLNAWQKLAGLIKHSYINDSRQLAIDLIESKIVYYKLRLLWLLIQTGRYQEVLDLLDNHFLIYTEQNLTYLPKKYAGIRRKIINSRNLFIWRLTKFIHRKKINLSG